MKKINQNEIQNNNNVIKNKWWIKKVEINFIGYIAFIYEDILRAAAAELNLTVGKVVQKPIESLVDYHKKYILELN